MCENQQQPSIDHAAPSVKPCRTCGHALAPDAPTAPFCSDRCRMADLGKWFSGQYKITRPIQDRDIETVD